MKKMIALQLRVLFNRIEFRVAFTITLLLSLFDFFNICYEFYGSDLCYVISAYEAWMGESTYATGLNLIFVLLPLMASIPYSDSYVEDYKTKAYIYMVTRTDKVRYFFSKGLVIFIGGFIVIFLPFLLNQILSLAAFPFVSEYSCHLTSTFEKMYTFEDYVFPWIRMNYPYFNNIIYIFIPAFFAGGYALFSYAFSLFF